MEIPNRIKHFLWRVVHNSYPLRSEFGLQRMENDDRCLLGSCRGEDGGHLFFKCHVVKNMCSGLGMDVHRAPVSHSARKGSHQIYHHSPTMLLIISSIEAYAQELIHLSGTAPTFQPPGAMLGDSKHGRSHLQVEVVACLQRVQAAVDLGITRISVETDTLLVK